MRGSSLSENKMPAHLLGPALLFAIATAVYWPGILSAAIAPRWAVFLVGIPVLLLLSPEKKQWQGIASWLWVWWLGYSAVSLAWTSDSLGGFNLLVHLLVIYGAFVVGALYGPRGAVYGVAVGLLPSLLIVPWDAGGLFWNKNVFAEVACLVAVFFIVERKYWLALPFILVLLNANSRAAILVLALVAAWNLPKRWWAWSVVSAGLFAVTYLTFIQRWGFDSLRVRFVIWQELINHLTWFGNGLGSLATTYPWMGYAHCDPLELVYELGISALVPLGLLGYTLSMEPKVHRYPDYYTGQDRAPKAVLYAFALMGLVSFPFASPVSACLSAAMAGYLCRTRSNVRVSELVLRIRYIFGIRAPSYARGTTSGG